MPFHKEIVEVFVALIICAECQREFSDTAAQCPQCAAPIDVASRGANASHAPSSAAVNFEPGGTEKISDNALVLNASLQEAVRIVSDSLGLVGKVESTETEPCVVSGSMRVGPFNAKAKMRAVLSETQDGRVQIDIPEPSGWQVNDHLKGLAQNSLIFAIENHVTPSKIPRKPSAGRILANYAILIIFLGVVIVPFIYVTDFSVETLFRGHSSTSDLRTDRDRSSSVRHVSATELRGHWVGDAFGNVVAPGSLARDHRILTINGTLRNVSSDSLRALVCPTVVTVQFTNGRSIALRAEDVCGDTAMLRAGTGLSGGNLAAMGGLTLRPGEEKAFGESSNSQAMLAKFGSGLGLSGEYAAYSVSSVTIDIEYVGETAFGDRIRGKLASAQLPDPSESRGFKFH